MDKIEPSKDFLEWYQERIKGMNPEEFKQYILGGSGVFHEPTEEERKMVDRASANYSRWFESDLKYIAPFDPDKRY